jgi:hypothetical protein
VTGLDSRQPENLLSSSSVVKAYLVLIWRKMEAGMETVYDLRRPVTSIYGANHWTADMLQSSGGDGKGGGQ